MSECYERIIIWIRFKKKYSIKLDVTLKYRMMRSIFWHRYEKNCSLAYPFYSIRRFTAQGHTAADVLLTVTYRFEIVLGTLGLNTRGCVPARYHRQALPKASQSDLLDGIGGIRRRAICHQIPVTINILSFPPQKTARYPLLSSARFPPAR